MRVTPEKEIPFEEDALVEIQEHLLQKRNMANTAFTLNKLSAEFYRDYNSVDYPEIECKQDRPYMVLVVKIESNTFALPFRTNIKHNSCYKFQNTNRQTNSSTGIDFSKAVIVNDPKYIGEAITIDNKEYVELSNKYYFIINKFQTYLNGYIRFCKEGGNTYTQKRYQYTTLRYFHKELKI